MNSLNILSTETDCLFSVSMVFPVIAIFAIAIVLFLKSKYNFIIGIASSIIVVLGGIVCLIKDGCIDNVIAFLLSILLALLLLLYSLKERENYISKGSYVIREAQDRTYAIVFYKGKYTVLAKSKYVYSSVEDARKAILLIQDSKNIQLKGEKNGYWTRFANYPRIETIEKNGKYIFQFALNDKYTILESDPFTSVEECNKKAKEIISRIYTNDVYVSEEIAIIHDNPSIDPYLDITTIIKEDKFQVSSEIKKEAYNPDSFINIPSYTEPKIENIIPKAVNDDIEKDINKEINIAPPTTSFDDALFDDNINIDDSIEPIVENKVVPTPELDNVVSNAASKSSDNDDEEDDENKKEIIVVDGKQMYVTYRKSIFAKVSLAHDITKEYYVELANFIGKYPVKRRDSWEFTSYSKSKTTIVKLGVKGRTLFLYLGLPYQEFQKEIFYLKESTAKAHEKTPTVLCVKSERSLKYAKELIEEVMKRNGIERDDSLENVESIETYQEKGVDELIREGLIKYFFTEIEDTNKENK